MNPPGGREHAKFSRKLHEIERIWTPRGGRASLTPPLDPPMVCPPSPVKISHKTDGGQRRSHRFHVSPTIRPLDPLLDSVAVRNAIKNLL